MSESAARPTVHAWGFYDDEGSPRLPNGVAVSADKPHDAFMRIRANIEQHGGTCTNTRVTRTLDGWFVGAEWETPERTDGPADRMWHMVARVSDSWPDPSSATPPEESQPMTRPRAHAFAALSRKTGAGRTTTGQPKVPEVETQACEAGGLHVLLVPNEEAE